MAVYNSRVLVIGDLHCPYWHPDTIAFLKEVNDTYAPNRVIQIGDEIDGHAISFHEHNPDLLSPGDELEKCIEKLQPLYRLFPKVDLLESNHGSLVYRKGVFAGLPRHVFKSYREILQAPKHWNWHFDLTITLSDGQPCYFHHGKTANPLGLSQSMGMSAVQGHFHEKFAINYWANSLGLYWQASTGCLVDDKSMAMAYNNNNLKRPMIGSLIILDGHPRLLPLVKDKHGRWIGKLV
jgi:hypothetical protein